MTKRKPESTRGQQERTPKGHWRKGTSGNPAGRPRGARHQATRAAEALLEGEAEALSRKAVELALEGDTVALRLCLERLVPPRRERPVDVDMPAIESASDLPGAVAALLAAAAGGDLTPGEAEKLARLVGETGRAIELHEIEQRLRALEEKSDAT